MTREHAPPADAPEIKPATLVSNSAWSVGAQVVGFAINGAVSIYAIRTLSVRDWGDYSVAIALVSILIVFSELGVSTVVLRRLSANDGAGSVVLGQAMATVLCTAAVSAVALLPLGLALGYSPPILVLLAVAAPVLALQPLLGLVRAAFNAHRMLRYPAQFASIQAGVFAVVAVILLAAGTGTVSLVIALGASQAVAFAIALRLARRRLSLRPVFRDALSSVPVVLRAAAPLAIVGGIAIIYDRLDVLLLSQLGDQADVAHYSVAFTLTKITWAVPSVIGAAFYPLLMRQLADNVADAQRSFTLIIRIFVVLGVTTALLLSVGGQDVLPFAFGERYDASVSVLAVMAWTNVLVFQNYVLWYGILACGAERLVVPVQIVGVVINVSANLVLIPALGAPGAAIALILSDAWTVLAELALVHRRLFPVVSISLIAKPLIAAAVALAAGILLSPVTALGAAIGSAATFVALTVGTRYVSVSEWKPLTAPVAAAFARVAAWRPRSA